VRTAAYSSISMLTSVLANANLRYDNGRAKKFLATGAQRLFFRLYACASRRVCFWVEQQH
ncbi:hypothetical protein, partial [Pseudoduganella buxea]|uniref:hypothetical protein n=1 Tax=Pseudoduganella buxea TaxID=1949069 RepID=UPI001B8A9013